MSGRQFYPLALNRRQRKNVVELMVSGLGNASLDTWAKDAREALDEALCDLSIHIGATEKAKGLVVTVALGGEFFDVRLLPMLRGLALHDGTDIMPDLKALRAIIDKHIAEEEAGLAEIAREIAEDEAAEQKP